MYMHLFFLFFFFIIKLLLLDLELLDMLCTKNLLFSLVIKSQYERFICFFFFTSVLLL